MLALLLAASLAHGAAVYQQSCAPCHGATGTRERFNGAEIDPLAGPRAEKRSVRRILKALIEGVPGTSMPSFAEGLSAEDRNAVAAYIQRWVRK
jgi:high-affinity iron transporter